LLPSHFFSFVHVATNKAMATIVAFFKWFIAKKATITSLPLLFF
jgi:hypothetical protein